MSQTKKNRPRRPTGRWIYYLFEQNMLWPCPVHWEWDRSYGGWLPFFYSPSMEFIAGDPNLTQRVDRASSPPLKKDLIQSIRNARR